MPFYAPEGNQAVLHAEDLADALKSYGHTILEGPNREPTIEDLFNHFKLTFPDGQVIFVKRDKTEGKVVVEVADWGSYDKKVRAKLRRRFVEPRPDILPAEVARQVGLVFKAFAPIWAERADQKERAANAEAHRLDRARSLADALSGRSRFEDPAVKLDEEDQRVELLIAGKGDDVIKAFLEVTNDGVTFEAEDLPLAAAMKVAEALGPFVALRVECGKKVGRGACTSHEAWGSYASSLVNAGERAEGRCEQHRKKEKVS